MSPSTLSRLALPAWRRLGLMALFLTILNTTACAAPQTLPGRIVGVTDGDTVTLLDAQDAQHKIRLAGIDAPESRMPYGQQAKAHLAALVFGQDVVAIARKKDRYGRTIATLMLGQKDVNLSMVEVGLAWHYKHYAKEQPAAEARAYAQAEVQAKDCGLGLWRDDEPTAPWEWRRSRRAHPPLGSTTTIIGNMTL